MKKTITKIAVLLQLGALWIGGAAVAQANSIYSSNFTQTGGTLTDPNPPNNPATGTITVTAAGAGPTLTLTGGATTGAGITTTVIGSLGGHGGTLWIEDGSTFTVSSNNTTAVAANGGSTGAMTVTGTGSKFTSGTGLTEIARHGTGTLDVLAAGLFTASGATTVGNGASATGTITVDGGSSEYISTGAALIGGAGTGTLKLFNGGKFTGSSTLNVANISGSTGTVTVGGTGSGTFSTTGSATIARHGTGTLNVLSSGSFTSGDLLVANGVAGNNGTVNVNAGSISASSLRLGYGTSNVANLTVEGGGKILSGNTQEAYIGYGLTSTTNVVIDGSGSQWTADRSFAYLGGSTSANRATAATLTASDAGIFKIGGSAHAGNGTGTLRVYSSGTVAGAGGTISAATVQNFGVINPGDLTTPATAGQLEITGNLTMQVTGFTGGSLVFDIASLTTFDSLKVTNITLATAGTDIYVNRLGGYTPNYGDTFKLLDRSGSYTAGGGPTFIFASPAEALNWDTSNFATTGEIEWITAVPEPSSLSMLLFGSVLFWAVGKRKGCRLQAVG